MSPDGIKHRDTATLLRTKNVLQTVFVYINENSLKKIVIFGMYRVRSKDGTVEEGGTND